MSRDRISLSPFFALVTVISCPDYDESRSHHDDDRRGHDHSRDDGGDDDASPSSDFLTGLEVGRTETTG
jgi:hypothetical protein